MIPNNIPSNDLRLLSPESTKPNETKILNWLKQETWKVVLKEEANKIGGRFALEIEDVETEMPI